MKKFKCAFCEKTFESLDAVRQHEQDYHTKKLARLREQGRILEKKE